MPGQRGKNHLTKETFGKAIEMEVIIVKKLWLILCAMFWVCAIGEPAGEKRRTRNAAKGRKAKKRVKGSKGVRVRKTTKGKAAGAKKTGARPEPVHEYTAGELFEINRWRMGRSGIKDSGWAIPL